MHYFKLHIGDYAKATTHLSMLEEGVYFRLLRICYDSENPLPIELEKVQRLVRAFSQDEKIAVRSVLEEFFQVSDDGWRHKRVEEELENFRQKSGKASKSAEFRWTKAKEPEQDMRTHSERIANAEETHCDGNANHKPLTTNHKPRTKDQEISTSDDVEVIADGGSPLPTNGSPACPTAKIIDLYHRLLPELPRVGKITPKRRGQIQQRWREDLQDLDQWENFFADVRVSDFLMGRAVPSKDRPPFRADIEFLTNATNFAKIYEGKYHR